MYKTLITPLLDRMDSETWHGNAKKALHLAEQTPFTLKLLEKFAYKHKRYSDPRLNLAVEGIQFDNPVMVAAGWDKAGLVVKALWQLGFSGVEVGTVVEQKQEGNEKPRQFVLAPGVALNRLGFNSPGMYVVAKNLSRYKKSGIPIGVSIGKNKDIPLKHAPKTHAVLTRCLFPYASYFAINVSSPNTPGLRKLQDKKPLTAIVQAVVETMESLGKRKPLFIKIAPDLNNHEVCDVIDVVLQQKLSGIIATNTTESKRVKARYGPSWKQMPGGISGNDEDFRRMSTEKVAFIYKETNGKMTIIGVGGVKNTKTALEKITSGASLVQVLTAIRGEGPTVAGKITRGISHWMEKNGVKSLREIIGCNTSSKTRLVLDA